MTDFSLMDAIECGIVKMPRVPIADNAMAGEDIPKYRDLWEHIGKDLPKKSAPKSGDLDPLKLPLLLLTALYSLYDHYTKVDRAWREAGIRVPPVFIVVCSNTAVSKLIYEWIAAGSTSTRTASGAWSTPATWSCSATTAGRACVPRPSTLLIDSAQLESGDALDKDFRAMAGPEIEQFKREMLSRGAAQKDIDNIPDAELLREVMNTVGKEGRLGADIRCVVSVSMLTEGVGHQHRHPHPGRACIRHPAPVRAGGGAGAAAAVLRPQR